MSEPCRAVRRGIVAACLVALAARAQAAPPTAADRELLAAADLGLAMPAAFRAELAIEPLSGGITVSFEVWRDGGSALLRFLDPKQKGKAILQLADGSWLLARGARPVRLGGAVAAASGMNLQDLLATSYSRDFALEDVTREPTPSGEIVTFALRTTAHDAPYPRVRYVVDAKARRPLRIESCLASGRVARMVELRAWRPGTRLAPAESVAKDLVGGRAPLRMTMRTLEERKPPAHLFELTPEGEAARTTLATPPSQEK